MPIARVMNWPEGEEIPVEATVPPNGATGGGPPEVTGAAAQGGGNLNGSQNTALLLGQAGTPGSKLGLPRANKGNYCGVI